MSEQSGIIICYLKCWPCQFGECETGWHTWADADDIEHAKQAGQPDPSARQCGCYCQKEVADEHITPTLPEGATTTGLDQTPSTTPEARS